MIFDRRCKPGDICIAEQIPFCRHFLLRTTFPLVEALNSPNFLMNVRPQFMAGDRITFYRYNNDTWQRVLEKCPEVTVVAVDNDGVELLRNIRPDEDADSDIIYVGQELDKDAGEPGIIVTRGFAGQFVIRVDGAEVTTRQTVIEANETAVRLGKETGRPVQEYVSKRVKQVA